MLPESGGRFPGWSAPEVPGDFNGFAIYREAFGVKPERLSRDLLDTSGEFLDTAPPPGPVTYRMATEAYSGKIRMVAATQVDARPGLMLRLDAPHPNPFQASTRIAFESAVEGPVDLRLVGVSGRTVAVLVDRTLPPGDFEFTWDGRDTAGRRAAAGLYFMRLVTPEGTRTAKIQKLD